MLRFSQAGYEKDAAKTNSSVHSAPSGWEWWVWVREVVEVLHSHGLLGIQSLTVSPIFQINQREKGQHFLRIKA